MSRTAATCILAMALPVLASCARRPIIHAGGLVVEVDPESGAFRRSVLGDGPGCDAVTIHDGKRKAAVATRPAGIRTRKRGWELGRRSEQGFLDIEEAVVGEASHVLWSVGIANRSDEEQWLELELCVPTGLEAELTQFWDGNVERPVKEGFRSRATLPFTFPAAGVYEPEGGRGVALGINPNQDFTYIRSRTQASDVGSSVLLCYAVRVVLEPGEEETVEFVLFGFPAKYGWREIVQRYYGLFPDVYSPTPGIHPGIVRGGRYFYGCNGKRHLQLEFTRRHRLGWDWSYGVFQTPGDWYPDEKYWIPDRGYPGPADRHHNAVKGSVEQYRIDTRKRFHEGRKSGALLFYVLPQMCEVDLIAKHFPDSYFVSSSGARDRVFKGYIKPDSDCIQAWFAGGTSYGDEVRRDFKRIVEDFRPSGFAFDCAYGSAIYGGPAQRGLRGRSWTDNGTVVATGIPLTGLFDWIHEQQVDGYRLGNCLNAAYTYTVIRGADTLMYEPSCFRELHWAPRRWPLRLNAGHKLIVHHMGYGELEGIIDWERLEPDQIKTALRGAVDYTLLWSLRMGFFPSYDFYGIRKVHEWGGMLEDVLCSGWQPVPAVETDDRLWTSRYGEGVGSFATVSNPTRRSIDAEVAIDASYVGKGIWLFADYYGEAIECRVESGRTRMKASLSPHAARVYRAVVRIDDAAVKAQGSVSYDPAPLRRGTLECKLSLEKPIASTFQCCLPAGSRVEEIDLNGKRVSKWTREGKAVRFRARLRERNTVRIAYVPEVVVADDAGILRDFRFISEGKPDCTILTSEEHNVAAQRIASYFEYLHLCRKNQTASVMGFEDSGPQIPICTDGARRGDCRRLVVIGSSDSALVSDYLPQAPAEGGVISCVERGGDRILVIAGRTPEVTDRAVLRLLGILDAKYEFYGFVVDRPFTRKAGLAGKVLH